MPNAAPWMACAKPAKLVPNTASHPLSGPCSSLHGSGFYDSLPLSFIMQVKEQKGGVVPHTEVLRVGDQLGC